MVEQEPPHRREHLFRIGLLSGQVLAERVEIDTDHDEALVAVSVVELAKLRELSDARRCPTRPEIDQDDLALVVGKPHGLAVDVCSFERRRGLADHLEAGQPVVEVVLDGLVGMPALARRLHTWRAMS